MLRSADVVTVVVAVSLLLPETGSAVLELAVAVFDKIVASGVFGFTVAVMTIVLKPLAAIVPRLTGLLYAPCGTASIVYVAPVNWTGSVSATETPWASDGPA